MKDTVIVYSVAQLSWCQLFFPMEFHNSMQWTTFHWYLNRSVKQQAEQRNQLIVHHIMHVTWDNIFTHWCCCAVLRSCSTDPFVTVGDKHGCKGSWYVQMLLVYDMWCRVWGDIYLMTIVFKIAWKSLSKVAYDRSVKSGKLCSLPYSWYHCY